MKTKTKTMQKIAVFMIFLMISFPFISANAWAQSLSVTKYNGKDNVEGVMAAVDDYLYVQIQIDPEETGMEITGENVFVSYEDIENFDSCILESDIYTCEYTSDSKDRTAQETSAYITLYDDTTPVAQDQIDILIDGKDPEIESFSVPSSLTENLSIDYELEDTACTACDSCSGLKTLEFYINDELVAESWFTEQTDSSIYDQSASICTYENTIEAAVPDLGIEEGSTEICLKITDRTNHEDESCQTTYVDYNPPIFDSSSFFILDKHDNEVGFIGEEEIEAEISINISDASSGLDTSTVYGNFSSLNPNMISQYENMLASCTDVGDNTYNCLWNIYIDNVNGSLPVSITASDNSGNFEEVSTSVILDYDGTKPIIHSIISIYDEYLNKDNNTIILEISEAESGLTAENIILDMSDLGIGEQSADECLNEGGTWYCTWEEFDASSTVANGRIVDITIEDIEDNVGNNYDSEESEDRGRFTYDGEEPEFINITIRPLGKDLDVLITEDVAEITAFIQDEYSGVDSYTVFADYSDFDEAEDYGEAEYCEEVEEGIYKCVWEYSGQLFGDESVKLNIIAYDLAGNVKDSEDDHEHGEIRVVEVQEYDADYWQEEAKVSPIPMLNPNFIRQSSTGTIIKLDTELASKTGSKPFVHEYVVESCQGYIYLPEEDYSSESYVDFPIYQQYYYPGETRDKKYLLVNVPPLLSGISANETIETEGGYVALFCNAEVIQSRSHYSDIYSPNEMVNISASLELTDGLFQEPSLTSIDKIQKHEKFIDVLTKITDFLEKIVNFGTKLCQPLNAIRSVVNNIGTLIDSLYVLFPSPGIMQAQKAFTKASDFVESIWAGKKPRPPGTNYAVVSLGFWCDLVLCEHCGKIWHDLLSSEMGAFGNTFIGEVPFNALLGLAYKGGSAIPEPKTDTTTTGSADGTGSGDDGSDDTGATPPEMPQQEADQDTYQAGQFQPGVGGEAVQAYFDPKENLVVALICMPPCLTGIYQRLMVYKYIFMSYNVCLNVAVLRGEDISQCEEFLKSQICQQIFGAFFWSWFSKLITLTLSKMIIYTASKAIEDLINCPGGGAFEAPQCKVYRSIDAIARIVGVIADLVDTVKYFNSTLGGLFEGNSTEEEEDNVKDDIEEYIEDQTGEAPY